MSGMQRADSVPQMLKLSPRFKLWQALGSKELSGRPRPLLELPCLFLLPPDVTLQTFGNPAQASAAGSVSEFGFMCWAGD